MSNSFKFKYDDLRSNDPTKKETALGLGDGASKTISYDHANARNVCFVWSDGKRFFLNYSYLVAGEYLPDENTISLIWTTHIVKLKGYRLEMLFDELMQHLPKYVVCVDLRYNQISENKSYSVNEIAVVEN